MSLWESPGEAGARLDALNEAWNRLRNDVWGRGVAPRAGIPQALADTVASRWLDWRAWYEDVRNDFTAALFGSYKSELDSWQAQYDRLYAQVQAAGVATPTAPAPIDLPQPAELPELPTPQVTVEDPQVTVNPRVTPTLGMMLVGAVAAGAVVLGGVLLFRRRA